MIISVCAVIAVVFICYGYMKKKTHQFNEMTKLDFPTWRAKFLSSKKHEALGMSRVLSLKAIHLAAEFDVITPQEKRSFEKHSRGEDPIMMMKDWISRALPTIERVLGPNFDASNADLIALLMLIALKGENQERDVRAFIDHMSK